MSLTFITGPAGAGKSHRLMQRIIEDATAHPERNYLLIVPEQYSMYTQSELIRLHPLHGLLNIDVLSLHKLALRILDETGASSRELLEESGKSIVLRRIALSLAGELPYLGKRLSKPGQITEMKSLLSELMQYHVLPADLGSGRPDRPPLLARKLRDIAVLYDAYQQYCEEGLLNTEEMPLFLAQMIPSSPSLAETTVAFDGFTGFTPIQLPVLAALMRACPEVIVTVTTDGGRAELFSMSREMVSSLTRIAAETGTPVLPSEHIAPNGQSRHASSEALSHLAGRLFRPGSDPWPGPADEISVRAMPDPASEIRDLAHRIRHAVREEGFRYRDFAIVCGDLALYGDLVHRIFPTYDIPFFIDEKRTILHHPLTEFLRAALAAVTGGWRTDALIRLLRTGLAPFTEEETDRLENYMLATGIRFRSQLLRPFVYSTQGQDPSVLPAMNALRERAVLWITPFADDFGAADATAVDRTKALFEFLLKSDIQQQLEDTADRLQDAGEASAALEYRQIYAVVIRLFDKVVDVLGDIPVTAEDYQAMFETALTESRIGIIPPCGDEVVVGDVERSRLSDIRVLAFVGVNDGLVPKPMRQGGILTDTDREVLQREGIVLSPGPEKTASEQRFYLYLALTKPSERLMLSYARTGSAGEALHPSWLIRSVMRLFPALSLQVSSCDSDILPETAAEGLRVLPRLLHEDTEAADPAYAASLHTALRAADPGSPLPDRLLKAAIPTKAPDRLSKAVSAGLYGQTIAGSASRLERYAACAFAHFAAFGLRLAEREEYAYSGVDRGNVLHEALSVYAAKVRESGRKWQDLTEQEREHLSDRCVEDAVRMYGNLLFQSSAKLSYEIRRLKRLMRRTVWVLTSQLAVSDFTPAGFEVAFRHAGRDRLTFPLGEGRSLQLRGRIDRIDLAEDPDRVYVAVYDYKTGRTSFDLGELMDGTQIQLPLYLSYALEAVREETGKTAEPAALFYVPVSDPVLTVSASPAEEEAADMLLKAHCPSGIVSSDRAALTHLDRELGRTRAGSPVIPVTMTKSGTPAKTSKTVSPDGFFLMTRYARHLARRFATEILDGNAAVSPISFGQKTACSYCPYKSVCGFDPRTGSVCRTPAPSKADVVFPVMAEIIGMNEVRS